MKRVLIIEDDQDIREFIQEVLGEMKDFAFAFTEADNGDDACALLAAGGYDLIFLDNRLPGVSGIELLREYRAQHRSAPDSPIIVLSGFIDEMTASVLPENERVWLLEKPISVPGLINTVELALRGRSLGESA